jgi:hypothetical protein
MRRLLLPALAALGALAAVLLAVRVLRSAADERVVSERPLDALTRAELYELAREHDIPGRSKMNKPELRTALSRAARSG